MPRAVQAGRSSSAHRFARKPALLMEAVEPRTLLSTAADTVIQPNIQILAQTASASSGNVSANLTNPTPSPTALTPALIDSAYNINRSWASGAGTTIAIVDA
jgi:subtilase family serine protease